MTMMERLPSHTGDHAKGFQMRLWMIPLLLLAGAIAWS
jgi:hypothetical protein